MAGGRLMPIAEIVALLSAQAEQLCHELLPAGRREGAEWRVGSVAGEPGQSLGVRLLGAKAGVWKDFATGDSRHRGDALDLVAMVRFGGDKIEALRWSRAWLGIEQADPASFRARRALAPAKKIQAERDELGKRVSALKLWLDARPVIGSPAAAYLGARGLDLEHFRRAPGAIRFAPECWCAEVQMRLPAMVTAITKGGDHVATHRTWLMEERGAWKKARLDKPKKVLGGFGGGCIPLWRGRSGRALREAPADDTVAIAEGIEDALTIAWHYPEWRCIAAVSLGNMAAVQLPAEIGDVILIFDRDGENPQAARARDQAVNALLMQDRSVREVRPPEGFKDMNDWHRSLSAEERGAA